METQTDKRLIAEENNLQYIETTAGMNGYPKDIKGAIIGFETFEQAQALADQKDLEIQTFLKRDGWQLWERLQGSVYEEQVNSAEDFGDNYSDAVCWETQEEFFAEEVAERLKDWDFGNLDQVETFIKNQREIWEAIENADPETEVVVTHEGKYYNTIPKRSMIWNFDSQTEAIGLI